MYNIHSHYETIFHRLKSIVTYRRLIYLSPYGTTQPENIERIADNIGHTNGNVKDGPMFVCYDQEPILGDFNHHFLDYVQNRFQPPFILVTTEKESDPLNEIEKRYNWPIVYYFHHAFAAHDWFRGYRYDASLIAPNQRRLTKKYITFNRLTSSRRVYRSLLISELIKRNLLDQGYVSYNDVCPESGHNYVRNLADARDDGLITQDVFLEAVGNICQAPLPLRIDYQDQEFIPNHSFVLSATEQTQQSFCYLVTETCYWERKHHLTEKIFKPIVSRMPFVLAGPAHNLKYLREYGFKTFDRWIDESYDDIEDPIERMQAIGATMSKICSYSLTELEDMLKEMQGVLDYNFNHFYSNEFLDYCWNELVVNLDAAARKFD